MLFSDHWGLFADFLWADIDVDSAMLGDAETISGRLSVEYLFPSNDTGRFFVNAGYGKLRADYDLSSLADFERDMASIGFGQRVKVGNRTNFRWELRYEQSTDDDEGLNGSTVEQGLLLAGFNFGPGGPPTDTDGDGVVDRKDDCPNTPRGARVDENGCPLDSDGDGVFDGIDQCANTPKDWPVDDKGCPADSDGDGVPDGEDACANTPRGAKVDSRGCPVDSDGDGVADGIDKCADTPRGAKVDARGCPKDSDGDGVADGLDRCPNTARGVTVDAQGCAVDSDGDGVPDGVDKCPDTPRGTSVDETGCPKAAPLFETPEQRTLVLEGVYFEVNKADLTPNSLGVLDRVAESLLAWPDVRVEIGGHTDSTGAAEYNKGLSDRRANSVRDYLIGRGVPADQLTAAGYGEEKPVSSNDTKAGRALNRRVELSRRD